MSQRWIVWAVVFASALIYFLSTDDDLLDYYPDVIPTAEDSLSISLGRLAHIEQLAGPETRKYYEEAGARTMASMAVASSSPAIESALWYADFWNASPKDLEEECNQRLEANPDDDELRLVLAAAYVDAERFADALATADDVLSRQPELWRAHAVRGLALARLERSDESQTAFELARQHLESAPDDWASIYAVEDGFDEYYEDDELAGPGVFRGLFGCDTLAERAILCGCVLSVFWVLAFFSGRRQRFEGGGTWRQLTLISLAVAALWSAPYALWAVVLSLDSVSRPDALEVLTLFPLAAFLVWGTMQRPTMSYAGKDALPLSTDTDLQAAVERIAAQHNLPAPRIREQQALNALADASPAFVGGLAPPSVVVYDSLNLMLDKDERQSVLAHEFGHIANHTIWWVTLVRVLGLTVTIGVLTFSSISVAIVAGLLFSLGLSRIVSRLCEFDCDRRAAELTDPIVTRRALRKIHIGHPFGHGLASELVYATATHPSLAQRIAALCAFDSECDHSEEYDAKQVRQAARRATVSGLLWAALLPTLVYLTTIPQSSVAAFWALLGVYFMPAMMMLFASRRIEKRRNQNVIGWKRSPFIRRLGIVLFWASLVLLGSSFFVADMFDDRALLLTTAGCVGAGMLIASGLAYIRGERCGERNQNLEQQTLAAIQRGDYAEVIRLTEDKSVLTGHRGHCILRYNVAVACMAVGDRQRSREMLEALLEDCPGFGMSAVLLAVLCLDDQEPERALQFALRAREELHPDDLLSYQLASRCLRRLGRIDEAKAESREAFERGPEEAAVIAQQALLALGSVP